VRLPRGKTAQPHRPALITSVLNRRRSASSPSATPTATTSEDPMVAVREIGRTDVLDGRQNDPTRQTRGPGSHHRLPALRRGGMDQRPDVVHRRSFAPAPSNLDAAPPDLRGPIPTRDTVRVTVAVIFGPTTEDHAMQKALAPDISTWPDDIPCLIGSRCGSCGATAFPAQPRCPKCSAGDMSELLRPRRGTLVAWTTQGSCPVRHTRGPRARRSFPSVSGW
jgi:hypothetical protein